MRTDSLVFAIAGAFFGLLAGWILGSQQAPAGRAVESAPRASQTTQVPAQAAAAPLDENKVRALRAQADANPNDAATRVLLGDLHFDAERYPDAIQWYEAALKIDPRNVNASTDLGVSYYYTNQPDRALQQFERSLSVDPNHMKTLLNQGIVRAFGKQDLQGAAASWRRVVELAPDTPEGQAARQALEGLKAAHPDLVGASSEAGGARDR